MQLFNAPMLSRNPVLHYVFARMGMAEERGLGLKSMKRRAERTELPLPRYAWRDPYLELTLFRNQAAATRTLTAEVLASLSSSEKHGWQWLSTKERVTTADYENAMRIPNRTAKNHIKKLVDLGLLQKMGAGPATFYKVLRR